MKDALAAEQPGEPPLRVALKTLLKDKEGGMGDESTSSDDDDNSTVTSTSRSTRTESTAHGGDSSTSSRSSTSSSSSDAGFGGGGGDDWKPGELLAGFGSALSSNLTLSLFFHNPTTDVVACRRTSGRP